MHYKIVHLVAFMGLTACGGSSISEVNFSTLAVFNDGAGVGTGTNTDGREILYMVPEVAELTRLLNEGSDDSFDESEQPVVAQANGYNIRQGTITSNGFTTNVLIAEKIGSDVPSISYLYDNDSDVLITFADTLSGTPSGTFVYSGIYFAGARGNVAERGEQGDLTLTANFSNSTFSIDAQSDNTSLTGNGFIDNNTGRISSGNLTFTIPGDSYSATTIGRFGNENAKDVSGLFYTNDSNPDFAGAFAGSR